MGAYPYALYLDSKIRGTAVQVASYFNSSIFDSDKTIVYIKRYKKHDKTFERVLSSFNLNFRFMSPGELDALDGQTVFYPFNAQSNCRLVANRRLKHIFVTHGESNKVSSVKPITRIYDHVAMSGRLSLERYYRSGLFDVHDYDTRRLVLTGDTFIGRTGFEHTGQVPVLFYAPTWEGGLPAENYSSLGSQHLYRTIVHFASLHGVADILIKPHPNLGHRIPDYLDHLVSLMLALRGAGLTVHLYANNIKLSMMRLLRLRSAGVSKINSLAGFSPAHALIDVSAMETQCINERIPYHVLMNGGSGLDGYAAPDHLLLYKHIAIQMDQEEVILPDGLGNGLSKEFTEKVITYGCATWEDQRPSERLESLLKYTTQ